MWSRARSRYLLRASKNRSSANPKLLFLSKMKGKPVSQKSADGHALSHTGLIKAIIYLLSMANRK